ncbi:MAG: rod shape-determining protein [Magnetococcales bacterium]|nr:rod shape-determining protein [Magnetococcales bacterium]
MSNRKHKGMMHTVIGYPQDIIGVKLLNRTQVIGNEAMEQRSFLDLCYPLEDGVLKDNGEKALDAAREVLKQAIAMAEPRAGDRIRGIIGVPARATVANKAQLLKITEGLMDVCMAVPEAFVVAYGLSKLINTMIVDIGAGTIDLCAMKGAIPKPENQLSILKGGNHVDQLLETAIRDAHSGVQIDRHLARTLKEQHAFVGPPREEVIVSLRVNGKPADLDITDALRVACEAIVPDIVEHIKKLILVYTPECQTEVIANIVLAGGGSRIRGLGAMIEQQLREYGDVHVTAVADPDYGGAHGALKLAMELPSEYWGQVGEMVGG